MFHIPYSIKQRGISLIELIVVIFIITLFSVMAVSNFPAIQRQYALSRATYELDQDVRKTEDLALSGVPLTGSDGGAIKAKGYGVYVNLSQSKKYLLYADVSNGSGGLADQKYEGDFGIAYGGTTPLCSSMASTVMADCIIQVIDISQENSNLYITLNNISGTSTSINFSPPNPSINIANIISLISPVEIVLGLSNDNSVTRKVQITTSGLINVQ